MKTYRTIPWQLILILILAVILRFWQLGQHPVSLNLDEVAIGYNSYSILKTGMDEYGQPWPIAFRSHDDYKAPLYIYLTTVPIAFFGLNALSVRLVSAIAGVVAVFLTHKLVSIFIGSFEKWRYLPSLTALVLAVSPWHISFSRAALETNLAVTLTLLGVWSFLKGRNQPQWWILSAISFSLSLYCYHSNKLFVPVIGFILVMMLWKHLWRHKNWAVVSLIVLVGLSAPLVPFALSPEGQLRFKGTNVFSNNQYLAANQDQLLEQWRQGIPYQAKLFHNQYWVGLQIFLQGYFTHFTYDFLFYGLLGPPVHHAPNIGLLYLWQLVFLLLGIYSLFRHDFPAKGLIIAWLLLAPVASGLTWDAPSSNRTAIVMPIPSLVTALGLWYGWRILDQEWWKRLYYVCMVSVMVFFLGLFLHNYYRIAPLTFADKWQYGYRQAIEYLESNSDKVEGFIISTNLRQPQNFAAFYTQYDPRIYIEVDGGTVSGGFNETRNAFGKYQFRPFDWNQLDPEYYYVELIEKAVTNIKPEQVINLPNQEPFIGIYRVIPPDETT